ncbi:HNH endonuclease signature motif containing protein [Brevibacterium oceani]|uniref:HNH endonuclease signature motif containing protein n=1 Tax=Brevibacterium oceani TaxID=358099 RepID=UPI001B31EBE1|nr:HNH endonuclease signature motif containing protein [Brevibacterium oceani]
MKGTKARSTRSNADATETTAASPRFAIRFESSMSHFAEAAMASDRARFEVFESASAVVLEQILLDYEFAVPEGAAPFRCETIAGTLDRLAQEAETAADLEHSTTAADTHTAERNEAAHGDDAGCPTIEAPSTAILPFDEAFARTQSEIASAEAEDDSASTLPDFPAFDRRMCFSQWVYENVDAEDLVEISTVLGTNAARTNRQMAWAMTIFYGLPCFADRVRGGEFTQAHVDVAAQLCANVAFEHLPELDAFLATKRADITCETLRKALAKAISLLVPPADLTEVATKRRRVDVEGHKDGSASLILSGPSAEIFSSYDRITGMALAVHGKKNAAFDLPSGVTVSDGRSIDQLRYDLFIRPVPELNVKVVSVDPVTGLQNTSEASLLDDNGELSPGVDTEDGLADFAKKVAERTAGADISRTAGSAFSADEQDRGPVEYWVKLRMPTTQQWLSHQAATVVTVPFLSLAGDSDLPGTFADGSPVPAEVARTIAGRSKSIQRILTDPATGTPIDAKATSYVVPQDLRKTLIEQWTVCTVPGCSRRAERAEMDHVVPFFHLAPAKGGLTRFGNLHPLCKKHHALKTADRYGVAMPKSGEVEYRFRHGISTTVVAPEQPINIAHALEIAALAQLRLKRWSLPTEMVPPAPQVLELMPGESTIRERDEKKRLQAAREEREQRLSRAFAEQRAARKRLRLQRCLDWENSVFQPCLPAGINPLAQKQLTGNARYPQAVKWRRLSVLDIEDTPFDPNDPDGHEDTTDPTGSAGNSRGNGTSGTDDGTTRTGAGATDTRPERTARTAARRANDPWDSQFVPKKVNWDHDLTVDPPPF